MKVSIDKDSCTACGLCSDACPDVFELGDETAVVKVSNIPSSLVESVKQAASDCPVEAIKLEE